MGVLNRQLVLSARPDGVPTARDFGILEMPVPEPGNGEFVVRNSYASLDPALRQRMTLADSYVPRLEIGEPMTATTVGVVVASRDPRFREGDHVAGHHTIADYTLTRAAPTTRFIDPNATASITNHLSVLGPTGLTAYFGMLRIVRPISGQTVLISAAAGAVGSVAGQVARLMGCQTIGIAGGPEKAKRLRDTFRFDAAIDYRGLDLAALTRAIREKAPDGIDAYFDNVGGIQLDAAIDTLRERGRVALCGLISQYNAITPPPPMLNLFKLIARSARVEGFIVRSYAEEFTDAAAVLAGWVREDSIRFREHVVERLEDAPAAFLMLFSGGNDGKLMVRLQ